jgi:hypothetical protein
MRTRIVASATAASVLLMNVAAAGRSPVEVSQEAKVAPAIFADASQNMKRPLVADISNNVKRPMIAVA